MNPAWARLPEWASISESTVGAVRIDDFKYRFINQPGGCPEPPGSWVR